MRINKYIAQATGLSRRKADIYVGEGRVKVNNKLADSGLQVSEKDLVTLDGRKVEILTPYYTIMFNKPVGYVCSRSGQGNKTIYELLPPEFQSLKTIGRLDKNSSGLLLLTSDGQLAFELTHPSYRKIKIYKIAVSPQLQPLHHQMINDIGIQLEDGISRLQLEQIREGDNTNWKVIMFEGRNRQIRRTLQSIGYKVAKLHRTQFGSYKLNDLASGNFIKIK